MRSITSRASLSLLAAAFALTACKGKEGTAPTPSISLSVSTHSLVIPCGKTASITATLARGGGFNGDVTVTASGLPAGVTLSFTPSRFSGSVTSASMDLFVDEAVPVGSYTIRVTGTSSIGTVSETFTLTVVEAPDYSLAVAPAALTLTRGTSGAATITITREGNFQGSVTLSLASPPAGVQGDFTPPATTGGSSALSLAVAPTVAAGDYTITIQGVASGLPDHTTTLALTVVDPLDFGLTVDPSPLSVQRGTSGNATVQITRSGGFAGAVTLSLVSPPTGVQGTFAPAAPTGTSSALTLTVASSVTPGSYTLTIQGTAAGPGVHTTTLALTVVDPPGFKMAISPWALTFDRGTSANTSVILERVGGFTGAITLSLVSQPAGISATFNPPSPTGNSSIMTLFVAASVATGQYTIAVKGVGEGVNDMGATLLLTVTAPPAIDLALGQSSVTLPQWQTTTVPVTLTRTNYGGDVTLSATGAPSGLAVSFNPTVVSGSTSTMTVEVGLLVPSGTYHLTISASGAGVVTVTRMLDVTVTTAPGTVVEYQFCSPANRPAFFAVQDGQGPWKIVPSTEVGGIARYRFPLNAGYGGGAFVVPQAVTSPSSARFGRAVALATPRTRTSSSGRVAGYPSRALAGAGTLYTSHYVFGTTADLVREGGDWCEETLVTGSLTGTAQGLSAGDVALMAFGNDWTTANGTGATGYTIEEAALRTGDLFASRRLANGTVDRWVIFRDINATQSGSMPLVDFNGATWVAAGTGNVTVNNALTDYIANATAYRTPNGNVGQVTTWSGWSKTAVRPYAMVPPSAQRTGDVMGVVVRASIGLPDREDDIRVVTAGFDPNANTADVTLGPRSPAATVSSAAVSPYLRLRAQGTLPPEYPMAVNVVYKLGSAWQGANGNVVNVAATRDYLATVGSASAYDLTMPDLSGLSGFPVESAMPQGEVWTTTQVWNVIGSTRISPDQPLTVGLRIFEGRTYRFQTF